MSSFIDRLLSRGNEAPRVRVERRTTNSPSTANRPSPAGSAKPSLQPARSLSSRDAPPKPRPTRPSPAPRAIAKSVAKKAVPAPKTKSGQKRKATLPIFGSDSEGDSDSQSGSATPQKRSRIDSSTPLDPRRRIRDVANWDSGADEPLDFIHSKQLCIDEHASIYKHQFDVPEGEFVEAQLRYPGSRCTETFRILNLRNPRSEDYDPITDLIATITTTLTHYLPASVADPLLGDKLQGTGLEYDLEQSVKFTDPSIFLTHLARYNTALASARASGLIAREIDAWPRVAPALVKRIIDQLYARTVSPKADQVGKIKNADRSNTYGELLPAFATQIFHDTALTSDSVFLDLGSGVGNIVIQAALEVGCEAHGIEMMPVSSALAAAQAAELPPRARLYGLRPGAVRLLTGDFRTHPAVPALLRRVDVVLVNNEVFSAPLNAGLKNMWLDLKHGARVVSLKSFVPDGWKLSERTDNDPMAAFDVVAREYWSSWVSWKDGGGEYYVATKDERRIERLLGQGRGRARRA